MLENQPSKTYVSGEGPAASVFRLGKTLPSGFSFQLDNKFGYNGNVLILIWKIVSIQITNRYIKVYDPTALTFRFRNT